MSLKSRLLILASLLGCVTFFLPFAYDTSPLKAIQDGSFWQLGVPFLVPFAAMVAGALRIQNGNLSPGQQRLFYVWAVVTLLVTLSMYLPTSNSVWPSAASEWIGLAMPIVVMAAGWVVFSRSRKAPGHDTRGPMLALRIAYLPTVCMCLYSFLDDSPNIGAFLALATTIVYAYDVATGGR